MFNNIIFVGGIHGVGKSTVCQQICNKCNIEYLSASKLIKWSELSEDTKNKKVENLSFTQDRLIVGLRNAVQENKTYILDGHYCLLNKSNDIEKVSFETFKKISPKMFVIFVRDVNEIKKQLEERDSKPYDVNFLERFQNNEIKYAQYLSELMNIPLIILEGSDYSEFITLLNQDFSNKV